MKQRKPKVCVDAKCSSENATSPQFLLCWNLIGQLLNDTTPKNAKRDFIKLTHNFAKMNTKDDSACKSLLDHKSYFVRLHNLNYSNDIIHTISK